MLISSVWFRRFLALAAVAMLMVGQSAEARALKVLQPDDPGSPSDQVRPIQRGMVQKSSMQSPVQSPYQKSSVVQKGAACCHKISYKHHCSLRKTCCCSCGTIEQVVVVDDPCCCGNSIAVPVCLPDCCTDCPKVVRNGGHLGRGVTTFVWCCGYKVKVIVDRCGDVTVHSYSR